MSLSHDFMMRLLIQKAGDKHSTFQCFPVRSGVHVALGPESIFHAWGDSVVPEATLCISQRRKM